MVHWLAHAFFCVGDLFVGVLCWCAEVNLCGLLSSNGSGNVLWWCLVSCTVELLRECLRPDRVSAGGEGATQGKRYWAPT